jgi:hypothetical protein
MDYLLNNISENKVTQVIQVNEFEQNIDYELPIYTNETMYEDLLKRRAPSTSLTSISSRVSSSGNLTEDNLFYIEDPFMFIMCYIKNPCIGIYSKDRIPRVLNQFRKNIIDDDNHFNIKKLTKSHKQILTNSFASGEVISTISEPLLNFFSHFLKTNIIVIKNKEIFKGILCNEDSFDTIIIIDKHGRGHYRLALFKGKHAIPWCEMKEFIFENKYFDQKLLDMCGVAELRTLAEKLDIKIVKEDENGKKIKLLKEELKTELIKKIIM